MGNKKELWDLFIAREEYNPALKDKFDRNPYWVSQNRNIFTPMVSEYLVKNGLEPQYPDNNKFALCLTHDIDTLFDNISKKQLVKNGVKSLIQLDLKGVEKAASASVIREINPNFHIRETLKYGEKYGARSSFYFLSLSPDEEDFNYEVAEISDLYELILKNKGEIGLHGGHLAYNNISKIQQEKEKLEAAIGKDIIGYRNHYLHFETPTTWEHLNDLKFSYDTTYGFADCAGFRNGMCHPYNPYSVNRDAFLDIFEIPLIIMDWTLWGYMNLDEKGQFELCKKLIDTVAANRGVMSILWHNDQMLGVRGEMYAALLKYADEKGAWMPTSGEVVEFWKDNKYHETSKSILEHLKSE